MSGKDSDSTSNFFQYEPKFCSTDWVYELLLCVIPSPSQGGDITKSDGSGGKSIYGNKFEDENFDVRHTGPGVLSMANSGQDTNSSQFFITLKKAEHLDFKHVAFGRVQDGMDVVKKMGELGTKDGAPIKKIVITDCGQL